VTSSKGLYLHDHAWSLCKEFQTPFKHLSENTARAPQGPADPQAASAWTAISRDDLLRGLIDAEREKLPAQRVVFLSDAGGGKSEALHWLAMQWNQPGSRRIAVRIPAELFFREPLSDCNPVTIHEKLLEILAESCASRVINTTDSTDQQRRRVLPSLHRHLERARHVGNLVLLIDGLDQVPQKSPLLDEVLTSRIWQRCTIVVAGRPYAIQTRQAIFDGPPNSPPADPLRWRFVRLEPLTADQVTRALRLGEEGRPKFQELPEGVQRLTSSPRVMSYMRKHLPPAEYAHLTSAADLYERVLQNLIVESAKNSRDVRLLGHTGSEANVPHSMSPLQVAKTLELLGCIAYTQVFHSHPSSDEQDNPGERQLNFGEVKPETPFLRFSELIAQRYTSTSRGGMSWDWRAMAALGTPLKQGVFEADPSAPGLNQVEWQDRTLLEFLVARYLATEGQSEQAELLSQHIFRPDRTQTTEMYWVWQYLCEMPPKVVEGSERQWLRMIEVLYQPAKPADAPGTTWTAQRSTEMIFRSWPRLSALCDTGPTQQKASQIRDRWWGEFEEIAAGKQGAARQQAARDFQADFLSIPAGKVTLGSRSGRGRFDDQTAKNWRNDIAEAVAAPDFERWLAGWVSRRDAAGCRFFGEGPVREAAIRAWEAFWPELVRRERAATDGGMALLEESFFPENERCQPDAPVDAFALGRSPVLNDWYRLFAPDHGLSGTPWAAAYKEYSGDGGQPAIFLSFYDAWAFCQWARFENQSCRLPWEHEWEHVAKLGVPWENDYWWHATVFLHDKATAFREGHPTKTTAPSQQHASPATQELDRQQGGVGRGVMDQLGNVWEWCQDQYEQVARRNPADAPGAVDRSRVLRGGSFRSFPVNCRSAIRGHWLPALIDDSNGFRAARAK
jgi:formylglycine-generating enzyme required for sulfatase activity